MCFCCPRTPRSRPPFLSCELPFIASEFSLPAHSKRRVLVFVRCLLVAQRRLNEQNRGREEHHSSRLCLATNAQRTTLRNFPFCSFVTCLAFPMLFFIIPCFLQPSSLVHLFLQKRKRVDELQKSLGHKYNSKFHSNAYLSNFPFSYV